MAPIKLKFVVSFSSQDKVQKVSSLLEEGSKRWLSDPQDRSGQAEAIFQLEQPSRLAFLDIGVIWCASIEVRVGKSDWPQGQSYVTLVPMQSLMSAIDARLSRNTMRTCMFSKAQFSEEGAQGEWDRIQVLCRQPWRKDVQLGLSFLRLRNVDSGVPASGTGSAESSVGGKQLGQKNKVADIQKHFFGDKSDENKSDSGLKQRLQKLASTAEGGTDNPDALPRIARMVLDANKRSLHPSPPSHHDNGTRLFSSTVKQQQTPPLPKEVSQFLDTLNISKRDIYSLRVSDLRHKFEKLKWRKLTTEEKRTFYICCQDFIGRLCDDDKNTTTNTNDTTNTNGTTNTNTNGTNNTNGTTNTNTSGTTNTNGTTSTSSSSPTATYSWKRNKDLLTDQGSVKKPPDGFSSASTHSPSASGRTFSRHGTKDPARGRASLEELGILTPSKNQGPGSAQKNNADCILGRGFPGRSFPQTKSSATATNTSFMPNKTDASSAFDKTCVTPHKTGSTHRNSAVVASADEGLVDNDNVENDHKPLPDTKQKHTYKPKTSLREQLQPYFPQITNRCQNSDSLIKGKVVSPGSVLSSLASRKLHSFENSTVLSSPKSTAVSPQKSNSTGRFSNIDSSLLNTRKQFVNARMRNTFSPTSQTSNLGTKRPTVSDQLHASSQSPGALSKGRGVVLGNVSGSKAMKRKGSPHGTSQNLTPAKRQPAPTTFEPSTSPQETGGSRWLNSTRGQGRERSLSQSHGDGGSHSQRGKKAETAQGADDLEDVSSPGTSRASRGRGRGTKRARGRGMGTTNRRLELPPASPTPSDETITPPASNHSDNPFLDELEIDEDAVFVECPMCQEMFPSDTVTLHAADCPGKSSSGVNQAVTFVQCPLCQDMFPDEIITGHASLCSL